LRNRSQKNRRQLKKKTRNPKKKKKTEDNMEKCGQSRKLSVKHKREKENKLGT